MPREKPDPAAEKAVDAPVRQPEAEYAAEELAQHPELFKCGPDIVKAALDFAKVTSCTVKRARELVKQFAERKV